jgi:alpha-L-arabinofuranosidase
MRASTCALLLASLLLPQAARAQSSGSATIAIQADQPGAAISSNLFGVFFEEINYAGEGGLYAEMVRNRTLANSANPDFWTLVSQGGATGQISVDASRPLNTNILQSLRLTMQSGSGTVGAGNAGFWGMALQAGSNYDLSFYACATNGFSGPLGARLESADGSTLYAQTSFSGLGPNWQRFTASLTPSATTTNGRLVLSLGQAGTVWLDVVSLFPRATFFSRTNGLRADLANMVAAMNPSFMRYPGGNFIEANNLTNAVRWKKTIGDIALRPGHLNDAWGYWSTDGFGLHEFLQFCEDLGMEPLYGINCGLALGYNGSTNNTVPLDQMGPWVQDALDLVQYANGDTNTPWGAQRAANGHPAPFNLKYIEIGNENGGSYYRDRYALFYDAIKSNYPDMHIIACVWGGTPTSRPVEIQDEHYYSSPATFISYATKYDSYSRRGPKVFVGEYAVTSGYGTYGNLAAALGEAAFMTGMERNSDVVQIASYAPLFENVNGNQWKPDSIYYDDSRVFGTPSHYVQRLFSQNRGDTVLPTSIAITAMPSNAAPQGAIGLGSWSTSVQYTNIVVTSNGVTLYQSDFVNSGTNGWRVYNGAWSASAGLYQQTSASTTDCRSTTGNTNWANYTITLRARKVSGSEGFLILFNWLDDNNWTWWNIGGWSNTKDGIEQMANGSKTTLAQVSQTAIQASQWYDISIVLTGARIQCYLNGNLVQDFTYPSLAGGLFASSSYARASGQIIVKAVNPYSAPMATTFNLTGLSSIAASATRIQLTSGSPADENSLTAPNSVFPVTNSIVNAGTNFTLTLPANSLSILRLQAVGLNTFTNLQLQCTSPINVGQTVPAALWGWKTGATSPVNLATNSTHAIVWSVADTGIAGVDSSGNVTGVGPGTTTLVAAYGGLGLSATQTVQVIGAPKALVHRYSFGDAPGSTIVADSVGGATWNGTLPNGGSFDGSQLTLSSNSQQYVQLPAGILSDYPAVTIEAWATFPTQIANNCFFFGFGNTSGSAGINYLFCAPQTGRIAMTAASYSGEQDAYGNTDFSYQTGFHVTAVFNPPGGYIALYTNGVLVGINAAFTVPMSAVNDVYSFIGKSLYSGDPYPDIILDEFRIYSGALNADEIAATEALGPGGLLSQDSPVMGVSAAGTSLTLSWPLASAGFTLQSRTNLIFGDWVAAEAPAPQIVGSQWLVTIPISNNAEYYRLQK